MAKQRLLVQSGLGEVAFRPGTAPVDTFVQPTAGRKLTALAEGLSAFAPALARFSDNMDSRERESGTKAGEAHMRAQMDEGKEYLEAINDGTIARTQSPYFQAGMREYGGRALGMRFAQHLRTEVAKELEGVTDMAQARQVVQGSRARFMAEAGINEDDRHGAHAFGRTSDAAINEFLHNFSANAGAKMQQNAAEEFFQVTHGVLNRVHDAGGSVADLGAAVSTEIERAIAMGLMSKEDANRAAAAAISSFAQDMLDPELLGDPSRDLEGIFDHIRVGTGPMSGTSYAGEARREVQLSIARENERRDQQSLVERERAEKAILRESVATLYERLEEDPNAPIDDLEAAMREAGAHSQIGVLRNVRDAARLQTQFDESPAHATRLTLQAHGVDPSRPGYRLTLARAAEEAAAGRITMQTFNHLSGLIEARDRGGENALSSFLKDDGRMYGERRIWSYFTNEQGQYFNAEAALLANEAVMKWNAAYLGQDFSQDPRGFQSFLDSKINTLVPDQYKEGSGDTNRSEFGRVRASSTATESRIGIPSTGGVTVDRTWGYRWGPRGSNPETQRILEDPVLERLENEWNAVMVDQSRNQFSPFVESVLSTYNLLSLQNEEFGRFIRRQRRLEWQ